MQPPLGDLFRQHHRPADLPVWFTLALLWLLARLPLPLLWCLAGVIGRACFYLHAPRRRICLRNLALCFPQQSPRQHRRLARRHFHALTCAFLTTGIGWSASKKRLHRLTRMHGREHLDQLTAKGANIILLAPHFAALEYGGIYLSSLRPMLSMYQRHKQPLLDAVIKRHRARFGIQQYASKASTKTMLQQIRAGLPFYYLPDQDPGRKGVFAKFYGIPTATFATLGRIAQITDAKVLPCCTRIRRFGRGFEIILAPPLDDFPEGDALRDSESMNRAIEKLIALAPEQYFWSHKRFKTRPRGEAGLY